MQHRQNVQQQLTQNDKNKETVSFSFQLPVRDLGLCYIKFSYFFYWFRDLKQKGYGPSHPGLIH